MEITNVDFERGFECHNKKSNSLYKLEGWR